MTPLSLLSSLLLLASVVAANSVVVNHSLVSLPLVRKLNLTSGHDLVKHDQARARAMRSPASERSAKVNGTNEPVMNQVVTYIASVGVGSPPKIYNLIVDTGSSNTWIGANKAYMRTNTSKFTLNAVHVTYGSGYFFGLEYTDTVTLAPGLVISGQSIGVAAFAGGFSGVDGILGLGPVDLTVGTRFPNSSMIPTVTDNLFGQGTIPDNLIAISFAPAASKSTGEITFGGTDPSQFNGSIVYIPITKTSPASNYWGIDQSISYGNTTILPLTAGIVDTGTTLILIATDAFNTYQKVTGAVMDATTGLLSITSAQFSNLQNLVFTIGGVAYNLTANAQIFPRSLNTAIGGNTNSIYLIVADIGSPSGQGLDFINGYAFLERFYSVYDTAAKRVGFATTPFTTATTN